MLACRERDLLWKSVAPLRGFGELSRPGPGSVIANQKHEPVRAGFFAASGRFGFAFGPLYLFGFIRRLQRAIPLAHNAPRSRLGLHSYSSAVHGHRALGVSLKHI